MNTPSRAERFEAIVADYYEDLEHGRTTPQLEKLLERNPDLEAELRRFLDDVQAVRERMRPLREAAGPTPLAQPIVVEPYELGPTLGEGGMGIVIRAHDKHLRRNVAIKVMQASAQDRPDLVQRFIAEAQILGQLEHPYVVPLHQLGELPDGRPFLAMKLVQGRTLAELLRERPSDPRELTAFLDRFIGVFTFVCQAIAHAHRRGIIHRDLKPANVMVGEHGEVQVMDWGLAKSLSRSEPVPQGAQIQHLRDGTDAWRSQSGDVLGTYAYMAPEQAAGKVDQLDARCDVFGLGAILCVILTGKPAYVASDRDTLRKLATEARLDDAWQRLQSCPADEAIRTLARQCLSRDPAERPRDAAAVADALDRRRLDREEQTRQADRDLAAANARAQSERTRRRLAYGLATAALLLACSGMAASWFYRMQAEREAELNRLESATARSVQQNLDEANSLANAMKSARLADLDRLASDRLALARKADEAAQRGPVSQEIQRKAEQARVDAEAERDALARDRKLMTRLLEVQFFSPSVGPAPEGAPANAIDEFARIDLEFGKAYRDWGVDLDAAPVESTALRFRSRPSAVALELVSGLDLWASLRREGNRDKATQLLELAAAADQPDPRRKLLRDLLGAKVIDRARVADLAKNTDPETEPTLNLVLLGRALWSLGEHDQMAGLLRAAVLARPDDALVRANLGSLALLRGGTSLVQLSLGKDAAAKARLETEAAAFFQEAVLHCDALRTLRPEASLMFASALLSTPRSEEGLALLRRIEQERPNDPYVHLMRAQGLLKKGDLKGAVDAAGKATQIAGTQSLGNIGALMQVDAAMAGKDWAKAEKLCRDVIGSTRYLDLLKSAEEKRRLSVNGKGPAADILALAYQGLAEALNKQGRVPEAIQALGEASRIIHAVPSGHAYLAMQLERAGNPAAGSVLLAQGWNEDPENVSLLIFSLEFAGRHNKLAEAAKARELLARAKFPDDPPSLARVGKGLLDLHEFDRAELALRKLLEAEPDNFVGAVNHATALMRLKRFKEAEPVANKVVTLRPENYLGHWLLGWSLFEQMQHDRAEAPLRKAIERKRDEPAPSLMLGINCLNLKRFEEAEKLLRRGLELDPSHSLGWFALSESLRALGRNDEAREVLSKAEKLKQAETP